jgi:hypothetical protein
MMDRVQRQEEKFGVETLKHQRWSGAEFMAWIGCPLLSASFQPDCELVVSLRTRTHSPHPSPGLATVHF